MSSNVPSRQFTPEEERAIERSKQAIDLATTISSGEQPSNVQLKKVIAAGKAGLEDVKMQSELQGTLYPEGEQFIKDTKALLTDAQILLDEKNRDEKFQKFVSDAQRLMDLLKVQAPMIGERVQRAVEPHAGRVSETFEEYLPEQRELLSRTVTYMRILVSQLVRSGEFRTLVADTIDLMRSLFIGGTQQLQQSVESTMSQMQQNVQSGRPILSTPYTAAQQGPEKYQTFHQPSVPLQQQPSSTTSTTTTSSPLSLSLTGTGLAGTQPAAMSSTASMASSAGEKGKWVATAAGQQGQGQFSGRRSGGSGKPFSYSSQQQHFKYETQKLVDQFIDILARYANRKEFSDAFRAELDMLSSFQAQLQGEAQVMAEKVKESTSDIWANPQFRVVYDDAINILEAFIGTNTWTPFWDSFMRWVKFIQYDTRTRAYFNEWKCFFTEALDKPELLSNSQFRSRMVDLIDRGQALSSELKWSTYTQDVFDKAQTMVENVLNDPLLNRISSDTQKLLSNLMTNEQGNLAFKPELMQQIRDIFVNLFAQQLKFIPMPEIRDVADLPLGKYEYILKNVVFRAEDILPEHMRIRTINDMDFNVKSFTTNAARTDVYIKIDHIVTKLQNVEFWFRRLSTPTMEDSGFVDIDMTGQGLEVIAHVIINPPSQQPIFDVQRIQCTVHDLSLKTKESKHDTIYNVVSGLFSGTLKRYIQDKIESEMTRNIAMLNQNLNQLIQVLPQQQGIGDIVSQQLKSAVGIEEQQQQPTVGKKAAIV